MLPSCCRGLCFGLFLVLRHGLRWHRNLWRKLEIHGKSKDAALAGDAFHSQFAAHQSHQSLANGEAEPRAAMESCERSIRLLKRLEDARLLLEWYASARVTDLELQALMKGSGLRHGNS